MRCDEAEELEDCIGVCQAYEDCVEEDYDVSACVDECQELADQDDDYAGLNFIVMAPPTATRAVTSSRSVRSWACASTWLRRRPGLPDHVARSRRRRSARHRRSRRAGLAASGRPGPGVLSRAGSGTPLVTACSNARSVPGWYTGGG